jgi:hypothetical protein
VPRQVQLVDESAHAQGIDAAVRRNYAGSDFDDETHNVSNLTVLARIGQVLTTSKTRPAGAKSRDQPPLPSSHSS